MVEIENKINELEKRTNVMAEALELVLVSEQRRLYEIRRVERENGLDTCTEDIEEIERLRSLIVSGRRTNDGNEKF